MSKETPTFTSAAGSSTDVITRPTASSSSPFQAIDGRLEATQNQTAPAGQPVAPFRLASNTGNFPQDASTNGSASNPKMPFILDEVNSVSSLQAPLRAIFAVDHDMNVEEIIQRLRGIPCIRHISLVNTNDVVVLDALKKSIGSLGFGAANIRIFGGGQPLEFIRFSSVLLGVQTVDGFHPGVRETIKIAAQEIHRLTSSSPAEYPRD